MLFIHNGTPFKPIVQHIFSLELTGMITTLQLLSTMHLTVEIHYKHIHGPNLYGDMDYSHVCCLISNT